MNERVEFANTLRGFAALTVVISHLYGVFWLNRDVVAMLTYSPVMPETRGTPNYISALWSVPNFSWGLYGVALFFLISGFVIPFSLTKLSAFQFLRNRAWRLVPTYAAGFTVTALAAYASSKYFGGVWDYKLHEIAIPLIPGLRDLIGTRGFDAVIWTLEIEVKFYLVCAAFIALFARKSKLVFLAPILVAAIALAFSWMIQKGAIQSPLATRLAMLCIFNAIFIVFMFVGVAFNYIYRSYICVDSGYLVIGSLLFVFAVLWSTSPYASSIGQIWNYGFAFLSFSFAYTHPGIFQNNKFFDFFANISYSLYVSHAVFGFVGLRILLDIGFKVSIALGLVTLTCLFNAWVIHLLIERPSQKLSKQKTKLARADI